MISQGLGKVSLRQMHIGCVTRSQKWNAAYKMPKKVNLEAGNSKEDSLMLATWLCCLDTMASV